MFLTAAVVDLNLGSGGKLCFSLIVVINRQLSRKVKLQYILVHVNQ